MSCKNTFEGFRCSPNQTLEIENQIKEMNIVESYDRREGSLQPHYLEERNNILAEEGHISKIPNSGSITDLKLTSSKGLKKSASNRLIHFPKIFDHKKKKKFPKHRLSYLEKYQKVKELQVNMFDEKNSSKIINIMCFNNFSFAKSNYPKDPKFINKD